MTTPTARRPRQAAVRVHPPAIRGDATPATPTKIIDLRKEVRVLILTPTDVKIVYK